MILFLPFARRTWHVRYWQWQSGKHCSRSQLDLPPTQPRGNQRRVHFGWAARREWVNCPLNLATKKRATTRLPLACPSSHNPFTAHHVYEILNIGPKTNLRCNVNGGFLIAAYAGFSKPGYGAQGGDDSGGFMADGSQQGSQSGGKVRIIYQGITAQDTTWTTKQAKPMLIAP